MTNNIPAAVTRMNEQLKALDIPGAISRAQAAATAQQASGTNSSNATKTVDPSLAAFYSSNGTTLPGTGTSTNGTNTSSTQMFYQMMQLMQMMMSQAFSNMSNARSNTSTNSTTSTTPASTTSTSSTSDTADSTASGTSTDLSTQELYSLTDKLLGQDINQANGTSVDVEKTLNYVKKMTKMSQNLFQ